MTDDFITAQMSSDWLTLNRQFLMGEIAGLHHALQRQAAQNQGQSWRPPAQSVSGKTLAEALPSPAAIQVLCDIFQLSSFEREILLLCAGAELSIGWGALCGQAQGNPRIKAPTFELANILATHESAERSPHWSAFSATSPLRFWHMLEVGAGDALITSPLRIDERILRYLLGLTGLDSRLAKWLKPGHSHETNRSILVPSHQVISDRISQLWQSADALPTLQLWGADLIAQRAIAITAAQRVGFTSYILNFKQLPFPLEQQKTLIELWQREAKLLPLALIIQGDIKDDSTHQTALLQWIETIDTPLILIGRDPHKVRAQSLVRYQVTAPTRLEQSQLWQQACCALPSPTTPAPTDETLRSVLDQFSLSAQQIQTAALQTLSETPTPETLPAVLWNTCRAQTRPRLDDLAQRLKPKEGWDDLVLPPLPTKTLAAMVACLR
ncbi:MAG: hypothetical protein AAFO06_23130, partial [Cyanobacteria bacterium J06597_16]